MFDTPDPRPLLEKTTKDLSKYFIQLIFSIRNVDLSVAIRFIPPGLISTQTFRFRHTSRLDCCLIRELAAYM